MDRVSANGGAKHWRHSAKRSTWPSPPESRSLRWCSALGSGRFRSRRHRRLRRLTLPPEHGALGRIEAEALQPVATESYDVGARFLTHRRSATRYRRELEHLDRARSERLPAVALGVLLFPVARLFCPDQNERA